MDEYERSIREKVHEAGILTPREWVYLVGVFCAVRELEEELKRLDARLNPSKHVTA